MLSAVASKTDVHRCEVHELVHAQTGAVPNNLGSIGKCFDMEIFVCIGWCDIQ